MTENPTNNLLGIGFVLLSCITITISALLIRTIGKDLSGFQVVLIRCGFSLIYILILNARRGPDLFISPRPGLLVIRSCVLAIVVLGNFYAIVHLPLVQVTALQFTKPLFLVVLAALFLSEKIRLPRTLATLCGFIGVLVILQPGTDTNAVQLIAIAAALSMAVIAVITKKMTRDHTTTAMVFYGNLCIVLLCLGPAIAYWQMPTLFQWGIIAALGLSAYAGQVLIVQAYRYAETTIVTPFEYIRLIFIAIAGFIVFAEIPDDWTIIGAIIISGSTLYITLREAKKKRRQQKV